MGDCTDCGSAGRIRIIKRSFLTGIILLLLCMSIWKLYTHMSFGERECQSGNGDCRVYYVLNLDGMKGLGHSALLLVDEKGFGKIFSYNGMQYSLFWCLTGKSGIGRMTEYSMTPEEVERFLETGILAAGNAGECDEFDRVLYRGVDREQYDRIVEAAGVYQEIGDKYEYLYAVLHERNGTDQAAKEQMARFLAEDLPRYQIYTHNCDTVARELLALTDEEIRQYNTSVHALTPAGNYRNMCRRLSSIWGMKRLGEDTLLEMLPGF